MNKKKLINNSFTPYARVLIKMSNNLIFSHRRTLEIKMKRSRMNIKKTDNLFLIIRSWQKQMMKLKADIYKSVKDSKRIIILTMY